MSAIMTAAGPHRGGTRYDDRRGGVMGLFRKRSPDEIWGIDRDSPEMQPINGVSLETYMMVNAVPRAGQSGDVVAAAAAQAGVSKPEWIEAAAGWRVRITSNRMVADAAQLVMDPTVTPMRAWDDRP